MPLVDFYDNGYKGRNTFTIQFFIHEKNHAMKKTALSLLLLGACFAVNAQNVGIGTTTPSEKLEVNGSIKITDGTQANGKVLISDANGKASWKQIMSKDTLSLSPISFILPT